MTYVVTGENVVRWVADRQGERGNFGGAATGIGVARDGQLLAGVVYGDHNGASCAMHVAALPRSRWLTRTTLFHFFAYPFLQLKLNVVIVSVAESNEKSRKLVEGVGFVLGHRIPDAHPTGALLVYTMTALQCRWTKLRNPNGKE